MELATPDVLEHIRKLCIWSDLLDALSLQRYALWEPRMVSHFLELRPQGLAERLRAFGTDGGGGTFRKWRIEEILWCSKHKKTYKRQSNVSLAQSGSLHETSTPAEWLENDSKQSLTLPTEHFHKKMEPFGHLDPQDFFISSFCVAWCFAITLSCCSLSSSAFAAPFRGFQRNGPMLGNTKVTEWSETNMFFHQYPIHSSSKLFVCWETAETNKQLFFLFDSLLRDLFSCPCRGTIATSRWRLLSPLVHALILSHGKVASSLSVSHLSLWEKRKFSLQPWSKS